mgnify:CR=1 FL=1
MRIVNKKKIGRYSKSSRKESSIKTKKKKIIKKLFKNDEINNLATLFTTRIEINRILYYNNVYKNLLKKPGVIMEFGVEWGSTLSLLIKLRSIHEPYNYSRKIIGFDTFSGFTNKLTTEEKKLGWKKSDYAVNKNYERVLGELLQLEEDNAPLSNIKKFELIKGDASTTVEKYIRNNPQTVIGMAIFDMDIYKPTKDVLQSIIKRLYKGSILVFDELNDKNFPGETIALLEVLGLNNLKLH